MKTSEESKNKNIDHELSQGCEIGNIYVVRDALLKGADVNYMNGKPLIYSINGEGNDFQKYQIVLYLEKMGARLDVRDGGALQAATRKTNSLDLVNYILNKGIRDDGTSIYNAARNQNKEILELLLERNIEVQDYVKEGIDELEIMKVQDSPIKIMLDNYFADGNHIIHETESEASSEIKEVDNAITQDQENNPSPSINSNQRSIAGAAIEQLDYSPEVKINLQDINRDIIQSNDAALNSVSSSNNGSKLDSPRGAAQKKTTTAGQDESLSTSNLDLSSNYQALELNAQFQEKEPKLFFLNLTIGLKMPDIENKEEQEMKEVKQEIEQSQENQLAQAFVAESIKTANETTWNGYGLDYVKNNVIYKPESLDNIVSPPSNSIIISDLLPKIDPITFLGTFALGQKQAIGLDLGNLGFMEGMFL